MYLLIEIDTSPVDPSYEANLEAALAIIENSFTYIFDNVAVSVPAVEKDNDDNDVIYPGGIPADAPYDPYGGEKHRYYEEN